MKDVHLKENILKAIQSFSEGNLTENGIALFDNLGYITDRQAPLDNPTYEEFKDSFIIDQKFDEKKAKTEEWEYVDLLFQLSSEEMRKRESLFKPTVEKYQPASYLFFAIELKKSNYSRNLLSQITREVNKLFPMHVFLIFKYGEFITLSLIDRRENKKVHDKDVMQKVTHIYNISTLKPHAAHIQILYSFSFDSIVSESKKKKILNFNDLHNGWRKVISTNILNKQFYLDYSKLSRTLINQVYPLQIDNKLTAHQGVLNLLNRIMFIYFVQKKEWIMNDENFIIHFWNDYKISGQSEKFHFHWLNSVFFKVFNGKPWEAHSSFEYLPKSVINKITEFPFLNGGLFTYNKDFDNFILTDSFFNDIFDFFEGYIFTISEDTPFDVNLEINPELLGKMYEGMINATDLNDVDAENGIIYTERPEINFMTRRSFVEVLDKKLEGNFSREFLYHFVFDEPEQKIQLLRHYKADIRSLRRAITSITVCDPACGSGSLLLGVIQLQMELIRALDEYSGNTHTSKDDFNIKKQLISECIYGVDIKEWAVRIAELRLWLYMIAEAEFDKSELTKEPLLPNLDFKLRRGNSLLQKFGSLDFSVKDLLKGRNKNSGATRKLNEFIKKKKQFIINQEESNTSFNQLKDEEFKVFIDFIDELIFEKENKLKKVIKPISQGKLFSESEQQEIDFYSEMRINLSNEIQNLHKLKYNIHQEKKLPFSYDIDFMEIFLVPDDPGFDLIIGNPPYVMQELILPPEDGEYLEYLMLPENKSQKAKVNKEYKEELSNKVYKTYPFLHTKAKVTIDGRIEVVPIYGTKVPGRSDLYCYFQLLCPSYLNGKGTFCFIISNSWLDVEFGSFIQHFLLKHTKLYAIYDCNVRSFDAKINTIIYLHSALMNIKDSSSNYYEISTPIDNTVRFIMNKVDYSSVSYSPLLIEQEHCNENTFNDIHRVIPINQMELYKAGLDVEEYQYTGDVWNGKYFKANQLFFKMCYNLRTINDVCEVVGGILTGDNNKYYFKKLEVDRSKIDSLKLIEVFKSPREVKKINLRMTDAHSLIQTKKISFKLKYADFLWVDLRGEKHICHQNIDNLPFEHNFYGINCISIDKYLFKAFINSSIGWFFIETLGRTGLGEGALRLTKKDIYKVPVIEKISFSIDESIYERDIKSVFIELGFDKTRSIRDQVPNPLPDRKELDDIIFDELDLTQEERNEVYWSVAELVKQRLDKASSR